MEVFSNENFHKAHDYIKSNCPDAYKLLVEDARAVKSGRYRSIPKFADIPEDWKGGLMKACDVPIAIQNIMVKHPDEYSKLLDAVWAGISTEQKESWLPENIEKKYNEIQAQIRAMQAAKMPKAEARPVQKPKPMTFEEQLQANWNSSDQIRTEFMKFEIYKAYEKSLLPK